MTKAASICTAAVLLAGLSIPRDVRASDSCPTAGSAGFWLPVTNLLTAVGGALWGSGQIELGVAGVADSDAGLGQAITTRTELLGAQARFGFRLGWGVGPRDAAGCDFSPETWWSALAAYQVRPSADVRLVGAIGFALDIAEPTGTGVAAVFGARWTPARDLEGEAELGYRVLTIGEEGLRHGLRLDLTARYRTGSLEPFAALRVEVAQHGTDDGERWSASIGPLLGVRVVFGGRAELP